MRPRHRRWLRLGCPVSVGGPALSLLVVGPGHRFAKRESVSFEELADEEVHENQAHTSAALFDAIVPRSPRRAGRSGAPTPGGAPRTSTS